jgi:hypothetical protein
MDQCCNLMVGQVLVFHASYNADFGLCRNSLQTPPELLELWRRWPPGQIDSKKSAGFEEEDRTGIVFGGRERRLSAAKKHVAEFSLSSFILVESTCMF